MDKSKPGVLDLMRGICQRQVRVSLQEIAGVIEAAAARRVIVGVGLNRVWDRQNRLSQLLRWHISQDVTALTECCGKQMCALPCTPLLMVIVHPILWGQARLYLGNDRSTQKLGQPQLCCAWPGLLSIRMVLCSAADSTLPSGEQRYEGCTSGITLGWP